MAQRTIRCSDELVLWARLFGRTAKPLSRTQCKEGISVPLRSRHLASDCTERFVDTFSVLKAVFQHSDSDGLILIAFDQLSARSRNARIDLPGSTGDWHSRLRSHELPRGAEAQVGVIGNLSR